ncbi:MAG: Xaa-Pro peptidase family protein [Planctomycetota bacterium]|jgi:Xaa-Pro aminopeptidase|nr:Xaa-Pro peptidase family protein [Planctomycetota bacterium]
MPTHPAQRRRLALNQWLESRNASLALVTAPEDVRYLTGFTGSDSYLVLSPRRPPRLVTDSRYREEAEKSAPGATVLLWLESPAKFAGKLLRKLRPTGRKVNLAIQPHHLELAFFQRLRQGLGPGVNWLDLGEPLTALRAVKDAGEVALLRRSLQVAEKAFQKARGRWRAGMSEREVKADLEWELLRQGADSPSFETIVATGTNSSLPHAHAGRRRLAPGKMLLIDFGATLAGYHSDLTRTLWVSDVPPLWRRRYEAVQEAQAAGMGCLAAGKAGYEADQAARQVFKAHGLERNFTHSLGHGVGLAIHEGPSLNWHNREKLQAGNVVTVEPGLYFPGSGGIRLEDMVLVGEKGGKCLSQLPRDLADLVL